MIGKPIMRYANTSNNIANQGFSGPVSSYLAYESWRGNTATDARVAAIMRSQIIGANCPGGHGGEGLKHTCHFVQAAAFVKRTPRLWNTEFTSTERTKIDLLVKQCAVGAAVQSDGNDRRKSLIGTPDYGTGANANWRLAKPFTIFAARSFLGGNAELTDFLNGFSRSAMTTALNAQGLTNAVAVSSNTATYTNSQVEAQIENWRFHSLGINDSDQMARDQISFCFKHTVVNGLFNGQGVDVNGNPPGERGKVINNPNPNRVELGRQGMTQEYETQDAEGLRSSWSYSSWANRLPMVGMIGLMVEGQLPRGNATWQAIKDRMHNGMLDHEYKARNGYYSYAHAATGGNNEPHGYPYGDGDEWNIGANHSAWFDVLKPWLDAG